MSTLRQETLYTRLRKTAPVTRRAASLALWVALLGGFGLLSAQEAAEEAYQFVSGVIASMGRDRIAVRRTVSGKPAETFVFIIDGGTRIEGTLRLQARVTVGYRRTERGDVAVRVIVRPEDRPPRRKG